MTAGLVLADDDGAPAGMVAVTPRFIDGLVARLHAEYGVDRDQIHRLAAEVLVIFADAPVQSFVPILLEKRLRQTFRALR